MFPSATALRRVSLVLVTLLMGAGPLVAAPPGAASGASHSAKRWAGYEIPRTGRAAGGWIGGYRIGRTPIFLITPTREPNRRGYHRARLVDDLGGRGGATHAETERAAWILSKYGGYRDATQAAAVDASVYALLVGGSWSTTGSRGARRINESPEWTTVRRFARIMVGQSRRHAGPYRARVVATSADAGGTNEAVVTVTDGHGRPAAGLPVTLAAAGASAVQAVTGDNGKAVARFEAPRAGWRRITATVREVPGHRLLVRMPLRRGQAAAAEGGVRRTLVASTRVAVRGAQTLDLRASPATVVAGSEARVVAAVTGDGTRRNATGTLYGPFGSASAARCTGHAVGTVRRAVGADGDYAFPSLRPAGGHYYVWRVSIDGTPTAVPVAACGAVTAVNAVPQVTVAIAHPQIAPGNATVEVRLRGLPRYPAVDMTLSVWGPYATQAQLTANSCAGTLADQKEQTMNGDATVTLSPYISKVGYYAVQATVPPADLRESGQSRCADIGTVLHVS